MTLARLILQTGYLILMPDPETGKYVTNFPNREGSTRLAPDLMELLTGRQELDFSQLLPVGLYGAVTRRPWKLSATICSPNWAWLGLRRCLRNIVSRPLYTYLSSLLLLANRSRACREVALHQGEADPVVEMPRERS